MRLFTVFIFLPALAALSALGVKRVSVGGGLARAALGAFLKGAREMREHGTFGFAQDAVSSRDINAIFRTTAAGRAT